MRSLSKQMRRERRRPISGGHFDYKQNHIKDVADEIERIIEVNSEAENKFRDETISLFKNGVKALRVAEIYARRIDWLLSFDDSEGSFKQRLKKELKDEKVKK